MINFEDIEKYLKKWPTWVGLILIFVPGILYQIRFGYEYLSTFGGLMVIPFLMISLYYSVPFLILGLILEFLARKDLNSKVKEEDFISIVMACILFYWAIDNFSGFGIWDFWEGYLLFFIMITLILMFRIIIFSLKSKSKLKKNLK